jgi:hypothetical protein
MNKQLRKFRSWALSPRPSTFAFFPALKTSRLTTLGVGFDLTYMTKVDYGKKFYPLFPVIGFVKYRGTGAGWVSVGLGIEWLYWRLDISKHIEFN